MVTDLEKKQSFWRQGEEQMKRSTEQPGEMSLQRKMEEGETKRSPRGVEGDEEHGNLKRKKGRRNRAMKRSWKV